MPKLQINLADTDLENRKATARYITEEINSSSWSQRYSKRSSAGAPPIAFRISGNTEYIEIDYYDQETLDDAATIFKELGVNNNIAKSKDIKEWIALYKLTKPLPTFSDLIEAASQKDYDLHGVINTILENHIAIKRTHFRPLSPDLKDRLLHQLETLNLFRETGFKALEAIKTADVKTLSAIAPELCEGTNLSLKGQIFQAKLENIVGAFEVNFPSWDGLPNSLSETWGRSLSYDVGVSVKHGNTEPGTYPNKLLPAERAIINAIARKDLNATKAIREELRDLPIEAITTAIESNDIKLIQALKHTPELLNIEIHGEGLDRDGYESVDSNPDSDFYGKAIHMPIEQSAKEANFEMVKYLVENGLKVTTVHPESLLNSTLHLLAQGHNKHVDKTKVKELEKIANYLATKGAKYCPSIYPDALESTKLRLAQKLPTKGNYATQKNDKTQEIKKTEQINLLKTLQSLSVKARLTGEDVDPEILSSVIKSKLIDHKSGGLTKKGEEVAKDLPKIELEAAIKLHKEFTRIKNLTRSHLSKPNPPKELTDILTKKGELTKLGHKLFQGYAFVKKAPGQEIM